MAGDWIKVEHWTPDKPEVYQIAETLSIDPDAVTGKLLRIWIWADQQTLNGDAHSVTRASLDRLAGVSGFTDAMVTAKWLTKTASGYTFVNFDRHNGETAKTRALTAKRNASLRKRRNGSDAHSVTPPSPPASPKEEKSERREKEEGDSHFFDPNNEQIPFDTSKPIPWGLTAEDLNRGDMLRVEASFLARWNATPGAAKVSGVRMASESIGRFRERVHEPGWINDAEAAMAKMPLLFWKGKPMPLDALLESQHAYLIAHGDKYQWDGKRDAPAAKPVDKSAGVTAAAQRAHEQQVALDNARIAREKAYRARLAEKWGADAGLITDKEVAALDAKHPMRGLYGALIAANKRTAKESQKRRYTAILHEVMEIDSGGLSFAETEAQTKESGNE